MSRRTRGPATPVPVGLILAVLAVTLGRGHAAADPQPASGRTAPLVDPQTPILEGRIVQGGLLIGHAVPGTRLRLGRHPIGVARDGTFLIGLAMDAPASFELTIASPDGTRERRVLEVEQRQYAEDRIFDLPPEEVDPAPAVRARLVRARGQIDRIRRRISPDSLFSSGFDWPARGRITSGYGVRRILNGQPRAPHDAIDIAVPIGTPVRAPAGGVVVFTAEDVPLAGRTIVVDHGLGLTSTLIHLSSIAVRPGDRVQRGDTLGRSGETGRTTGPHVEWSVHLHGVALDPAIVLESHASATGARGAVAPGTGRG